MTLTGPSLLTEIKKLGKSLWKAATNYSHHVDICNLDNISEIVDFPKFSTIHPIVCLKIKFTVKFGKSIWGTKTCVPFL